MNSFGVKIKTLRERSNLLQRQVAAKLDMDTAMLSKVERGERRAKREQVINLAELFKVDKEDLLSLWLAAKLYDVLKDEDVAPRALKVAEKEVNYKIKTRNGK